MKKPFKWFLYMLRCKDGSFYTGITLEPPRRLAQHNAGKASRYTRARLPVKMVYLEKCKTRSLALRREYAVKSLTRRQKENLIK